MLNEPSGFDTAKYGWSSTPANAFIQPCTSHLNGTTTSASFAVNVCVVFMPLIGWAVLNSAFVFGVA